MADPQQEAALREAIINRLLGGSAAPAPAPIAPVASHPARSEVVLESRRTPKRRAYHQTERVQLNPPLDPNFFGQIRGIENNWQPGMEGQMTRPMYELTEQLALGVGPGSIENVAAKMGMLATRRAPVQRVGDQRAADEAAKWERQSQNMALQEGRNVNDAITPLTREQRLISDSFEQMRKVDDDYSAWFSSQEEKLPEGQFFKPPPAVEAAHRAKMQQLKDAHEALVKRLTGGYQKDPLPDIDIAPVASHRTSRD